MKYFFVFGAVLLSSVIPAGSSAYFTTAQSATILDGGGGALYTVTYDFGTKKYDVYMPIIPVLKPEQGSKKRVMTYNLTTGKDSASIINRVESLVLSNAEIRDGYYFIPKGVAHRLTFVSAVSFSDSFTQNSSAVSLQITDLPFLLKTGSTTVEAQLNPSELQYYITPAITP